MMGRLAYFCATNFLWDWFRYDGFAKDGEGLRCVDQTTCSDPERVWAKPRPIARVVCRYPTRSTSELKGPSFLLWDLTEMQVKVCSARMEQTNTVMTHQIPPRVTMSNASSYSRVLTNVKYTSHAICKLKRDADQRKDSCPVSPILWRFVN